MRPQEMHLQTELQQVQTTQQLDIIVDEKFTNFRNLQAKFEANEMHDRKYYRIENTYSYSAARSKIQATIDKELIEHLKKLWKDNLELREEILQIKTNMATTSEMKITAKGMRNPYAVEEMD